MADGLCLMAKRWGKPEHLAISHQPLAMTTDGALAMSSFSTSRFMFLRLLGCVYLCAFASLILQIAGLVGRNGILPAGPGDAILRAACIGGALVSLVLVAGFIPIVAVPLLWLLYWWLSTIGAEFLSYQWDALLLETGALAMLVAPVVWRERANDPHEPPRIAVWLMWWLVFRLMFGSGAVKLASGDPTWRDLSAMTFHYETQPIPNPVAFYAHHLPVAFNKASTAITLAIELVAPLLIVGPRRLRLVAAVLLVGLQLLIAATGNFAFFNLLAVALCVWLVDDEVWQHVAQAFRSAIAQSQYAASAFRRTVAITAAVVIVPVSLLHFTSSLGVLLPGWQLIAPIAELVSPLRSVNTYGLFAVMTTTRPEIIMEGSDDGESWQAYEFTYKPGDLHRRPPVVAPHQPRLDWQMWFAALGRYEENPWFQNFCVRLLQGSPEVQHLLARDPFNGRAPRYIRAELYQYHFAPMSTRRAEGVWWTRERLGAYSPVLSLR
jgi:lipase maturation factor 1